MSRHYPVLRMAVRAAVGVVIISVGLLTIYVLISSRPVAPRTDDLQAARSVEVVEAQRLHVRRQWRGFGTAEPRDFAAVPARVTTAVVEVPDDIRAGRLVRQGQLLAKLDDTDFVQQKQIAEQQLADLDAQLELLGVERTRLAERITLEEQDVDLAQAELERLRDLYERGATSTKNLDDATRLLINAQRNLNLSRETYDRLTPRGSQLAAQRLSQMASLKLAQINVERCTITSPLDGVVESVDVEPGESVLAGSQVARIVGLARMDVPIQLPTSARGAVRVGDTVELMTTGDRSTLRREATVTRIAPVDDVDARTMTIYVEVAQPQANDQFESGEGHQLLLPGMFVAGMVTNQAIDDRWILPRRAIRNQRVKVVREAMVVSQPVAIDYIIDSRFISSDLADDEWVVLRDEATMLDEGDLVIVDGSLTILDGERVDPQTIRMTSALRKDVTTTARRPGEEAVP